jgi:putative phosphoribosyl transferase
MAAGDVIIPLTDIKLEAELRLPDDAIGLVIFAHGSGSSRRSPRNQLVARALREHRLGTLLFDLLTPEEEQAEAYTRHFRFNIPFLAGRLAGATYWALQHIQGRDLGIGYFGSSTGAAAAIVAASELRDMIGAVVSRGGRADLAGEALERVTAPVLMIVGGNDTAVLRLNEEAAARMHGEKALRIVSGASHLFEEPGALEVVADMTSDWFVGHLHSVAPRVT